MFFNNWMGLLRILVIGVASYIGLVIILRISGNRTLSKMNSFDFVITIALGSTFASGLLQKSVALVDTLFAITLLVCLQYLTTWLSVKSTTFDQILKAKPTLLFANGQFLHKSLQKAHVTEEEVRAGMREQGFSTLDQVQFVVLESNGKITATRKSLNSKASTLQRRTS